MDQISEPLKIYCDNEATRHFSQNKKCSSKSKYLEVKYFIWKEKVRDRLVSIVGAPTDLLIVDPLTKALPSKAYNRHVLNMGLYKFPY